MEYLASAIAQHGYFILFLLVFLESVGFPAPAAPALLIAGGASAHGPMHPAAAIATPLAALLAGDAIMFWMGRHTGWWLLGKLCRLSLNPDSCILGSADAFFKRGRTVLLFAKFVPGMSTMAAPLAGSMNMNLRQFLAFDMGGAALYTPWPIGASVTCSAMFWGRSPGATCSSGIMSAGLIAILFLGYSDISRSARVPGAEARPHRGDEGS